MTRYIIEHPTRGTLRLIEEDASRWSWSGRRSDPEKTVQFTNFTAALKAHKRIPEETIRAKAQILRSPEGEEMEWVQMGVPL